MKSPKPEKEISRVISKIEMMNLLDDAYEGIDSGDEEDVQHEQQLVLMPSRGNVIAFRANVNGFNTNGIHVVWIHKLWVKSIMPWRRMSSKFYNAINLCKTLLQFSEWMNFLKKIS